MRASVCFATTDTRFQPNYGDRHSTAAPTPGAERHLRRRRSPLPCRATLRSVGKERCSPTRTECSYHARSSILRAARFTESSTTQCRVENCCTAGSHLFPSTCRSRSEDRRRTRPPRPQRRTPGARGQALHRRRRGTRSHARAGRRFSERRCDEHSASAAVERAGAGDRRFYRCRRATCNVH